MHSDNQASRDGASRQATLRSISPDRESARRNRELLLSILDEEMAYRERDDDWDFYENLYWCAFLLYLAGDLRDVPTIWRAKRINMDTGSGLDGQCLIGAGLDQTLLYLQSLNEQSALEHVKKMNECGDFDDIAGWEKSKVRYFYETAA